MLRMPIGQLVMKDEDAEEKAYRLLTLPAMVPGMVSAAAEREIEVLDER